MNPVEVRVQLKVKNNQNDHAINVNGYYGLLQDYFISTFTRIVLPFPIGLHQRKMEAEHLGLFSL